VCKKEPIAMEIKPVTNFQEVISSSQAAKHDQVPSRHEQTTEHHNQVPSCHEQTTEHHNQVPSRHEHTMEHHNQVPSRHEQTTEHDDHITEHDEHTTIHHDQAPSRHEHTTEHHITEHHEHTTKHHDQAPCRHEQTTEHDDHITEHDEHTTKHDEQKSSDDRVTAREKNNGQPCRIVKTYKYSRKVVDGKVIEKKKSIKQVDDNWFILNEDNSWKPVTKERALSAPSVIKRSEFPDKDSKRCGFCLHRNSDELLTFSLLRNFAYRPRHLFLI
jgi:hypothetical protein